MGQVAHALLTRPPLRHVSQTDASISQFQHVPVRLACVRHAASVHPEPGSNSHVVSFSPGQAFSGLSVPLRSAVFFRFPLLFTVFGSFFSLNILFRNFQGCTAVFLSRFSVSSAQAFETLLLFLPQLI